MSTSVKYHFKQPTESTGYLLWQTTMTWQRLMNRALSEIELTHTQFVLMASLGWLMRSEEEITQKDIAENSNTDRMMVSKVLRTLQSKGYISRRESPTDTRSKRVELTPSGTAKLQTALGVVKKTDKAFFSKVSDIKQFNAELLRLSTSNTEK